MKTWTKVNFDTLSDERIKDLFKKEGIKGFGAYMLLFLYCDCYNGMSEETLELIGSKYCSRNLVSKIINEYGLFESNRDRFVRALMCGGARAHTSASASQHTDAGYSNYLENKKENKNNNKSVSKEEQTGLFADADETDKFYSGMMENYPSVMSMQRPLEKRQYDKLVERFGEERTVQTIRELENYPKNKKNYVSAYLTLLKWCVPKEQR